MKSLEQKVYEKLKAKGMKIATAESCTGGLLAGRLINVSGASEIFDMGLVTYANQAKESLVYVRSESLSQFGAVSEQVAGEMAMGVTKRAGADVGLSTTGIAGPTGGTKDKPVGMVCFGIAISGNVYTFTKYFKPISRKYVRNSSVKFILSKLLELLN